MLITSLLLLNVTTSVVWRCNGAPCTEVASVLWRAMSANIMCVVYVKLLCAVCMQTCGVYASTRGVYASTRGVYASMCGVYESTCGVYAYVWCVCQNHVLCVCQNHVRCVCQKFVSGVYVKNL